MTDSDNEEYSNSAFIYSSCIDRTLIIYSDNIII